MAECAYCGKQYHACSSCQCEDWYYECCCEAHRDAFHAADIGLVMDRLKNGGTKEDLEDELPDWMIEKAVEAVKK
jgi:hypothetical protein